MNNTKGLFRLTQELCRATRRNASNEAVREVPSPRFARLKRIQQKFGIDDGVPIHIKGGYKDIALFYTTAALVLTGVAGGLHTFYTLAFRK